MESNRERQEDKCLRNKKQYSIFNTQCSMFINKQKVQESDTTDDEERNNSWLHKKQLNN